MTNQIQSIPIEKLTAHPDNPNRMSKANFAKLVRNIERTGRYEPLVVRPCSEREGLFQIINGHHRCKALSQLDYKTADAIVWDVDDEQADILLATLNRLGGSDELSKKLKLLKRLNENLGAKKLGKILPQTAKQIERLISLTRPSVPTKMAAKPFATPLVFFANDKQLQTIEDALSAAKECQNEKTKATQNAAALAYIARYFLNNSKKVGQKDKLK